MYRTPGTSGVARLNAVAPAVVRSCSAPALFMSEALTTSGMWAKRGSVGVSIASATGDPAWGVPIVTRAFTRRWNYGSLANA